MSAHAADADFLDEIPVTSQDVEDEEKRQDLLEDFDYRDYLFIATRCCCPCGCGVRLDVLAQLGDLCVWCAAAGAVGRSCRELP